MKTIFNDSWAVIFDMDGVLIDSYNAHYQSWKDVLGRYGLPLSEELFAESFGRTNPDIFATYFPQIAPEDYDARGDEKEEAYRDIIRQAFPEMEGARELLRRLHEAGALMGIGSSGPNLNVAAALEGLGEPYAEWLGTFTHGQEVSRGKPDPEVFLKTAEKLGIQPARCIVVEDAPAGVAAGKAVGMKVIALTGTTTAEQLAEADWVVNHLDEVTAEKARELL